MKKAICIIICSVVLLICVLLTLRFTYNAYLVHSYNQNKLHVSTTPLKIFNPFEKYIVYYNQGNIDYRKGEFENAIEEYDKALTYHIPKGEECVVRINKSLAMAKTVEADYLQPTLANIDDTIEVLTAARDNLLIDECAKAEEEGHNEDAQTLKEELEKMIEELEKQKEQQQQEQQNQQQQQNQQNQQNQNQEQQNQEQQNQQNEQQGQNQQEQQQHGDQDSGLSEEEQKEKDLEDKLKGQMNQGQHERQDAEESRRDDDYNFDLDGKIW